MPVRKRYEILDSLPAYGPMYIPVTGTGDTHFYSEGYVVRFFKSGGGEWVANFAPGWSGCSGVYDFPGHDRTIVIAGGFGYVMSPEREVPFFTFGYDIRDMIPMENGSMVCSGQSSVILVDAEAGELWISERISWDGITGLKLEGVTLTGLSYDPTNANDEWVPFSVNLKTRTIEGGSYRISLELNSRKQDFKETVYTIW